MSHLQEPLTKRKLNGAPRTSLPYTSLIVSIHYKHTECYGFWYCIY